MLTGLRARRSAALTLAIAGLGAGAVAAPASADALAPATCAADGALSQPFAAWGDANEYRLVPGGDFSGGAPGWTLSSGASITAGGDPFDLTGTPSASSLSLPAGASAVSPATCVDVTQPTFRFLDAADTAGSSVLVSVVYTTAAGQVTAPVGVLGGSGSWAPSPTFRNGSALAGLLQGGTAQMAIRFDGLSGTTQLDDVFVDPRQDWG